MSWTARLVLAAALVGVSGVWPLLAHRDPASIVIVTGQEATAPVPTLIENGQNTLANQDVADQLFLRLADVGPGMVTAGDQGFVPMLARSWTRRDSLTLVFELDPRARWHDGAPVTSRDVLFTFAPRPGLRHRAAPRQRHPPDRLRRGGRRASGRLPVPGGVRGAVLRRHLSRRDRAGAPAGAAAARPRRPGPSLRRIPSGSGPYRWVRRQPGEFIELAAERRLLPGRTGDRAGDRPGRRERRRPAQSAPGRRGGRDGEHPAADHQHRASDGSRSTCGSSRYPRATSATSSSTSVIPRIPGNRIRSWPTRTSAVP